MAASHHGVPNDRDPSQDALMRRLVEQCERRAKREYPQGRVGGDDEGALAMAVAADRAKGIVRIDFGKPVEWLGLPPEEAVALAQLLIQKAREASSEPLSVTIG